MKAKRLWPIALLATVLLLAVSAPALATGKSATTDIPYDLSPTIKNLPAPHQKYPVGTKLDTSLAGPLVATLGAPDIVLTLYDWDPAHGGSYEVPFWKVASGTHSDIYVAWNDLAAPPTSSQQDQTITEEQIAYMADEFDRVIWASDVFHFGNYESRTPEGQGEEEYGKRAQIFVYNIRDEAYWSSYRFYIAGYFSSSLNDDLGLNAIFVDSYNWVDRIGEGVARPHLYEGTIAHEFEHLIHNDVDGNEDSFIDEGLADLAEQFIYGTETTSGHIGEYLYYHRDSLIDWKGELFDYGNAVLWQDYLWEHAGGGDLDAALDSRVEAGYEGEDRFLDTAGEVHGYGRCLRLEPHPRPGQRPEERCRPGRRGNDPRQEPVP